MNHLLKKRLAAGVLVGAVIISGLTGCGSTASAPETKAQTIQESLTIETVEQTETVVESVEEIVENLPVDPDEVAISIDGVDVKASELFYYYAGTKRQMEAMYQAYGMDLDYTYSVEDGMTLGDSLKRQVEVQVLNTLFLNAKSSEYPVELTEDDLEKIENGVNSFFANMDEKDIEQYGFTEDNVRVTLENNTKAGKILDAIVTENTQALTEEEKEECKYRTVQHILFLYEDRNATGEVSESEAEEYKMAQKTKAEEILARARDGEDFETLAAEYNEDSGVEYSFNKNGTTLEGTRFVEQFVAVGNALKEGEMAIAETEYGYHVMKCVTENNEELYNSAIRTAALEKLNEVYYAWIETNNPVFYDFWLDYIVTNPEPIVSEEETQASE